MSLRSRPASHAIQQRAPRDFPPLVVQQLQELETELGGRQALVGMLTLAPLTKDLRYFLGLLGDPHCREHSLAEICTTANVLPGALLQELAQAAMLVGKVRAAQQVAKGIAAVAEDVIRRGAPYEEACTTCRGTGSITPDPSAAQPNPSPGPCSTCQGGGRLRYEPELERQKLALELAQLLPKGGGVNIAVQQNNQGSSGGGQGTLEKITHLTDQLLYGDDMGTTPDVIDADTTEGDSV